MGSIFFGFVIGLIAWFLVRYLAAGFYTVNQNERAVKTSFGRAERVGNAMTAQDPIAASLDAEEKERYTYPQVRVIPPGGPYFKWPWEKVYKVSVATQTMNMAHDPEDAEPIPRAPSSKPSPRTSSTPASRARSAGASRSAIFTPISSA